MATPDGHVIVAPALLVPMLPSAKVREVRRPGEYYYTAVPGLGGYRTVPWYLSFGAGAGARGPWGLAPVVATASFPLINLPNFYLSFTILVSLILVKYPDRVGLVNTVRALIMLPCP